MTQEIERVKKSYDLLLMESIDGVKFLIFLHVILGNVYYTLDIVHNVPVKCTTLQYCSFYSLTSIQRCSSHTLFTSCRRN